MLKENIQSNGRSEAPVPFKLINKGRHYSWNLLRPKPFVHFRLFGR